MRRGRGLRWLCGTSLGYYGERETMQRLPLWLQVSEDAMKQVNRPIRLCWLAYYASTLEGGWLENGLGGGQWPTTETLGCLGG
jgi:hypothetical protein